MKIRLGLVAAALMCGSFVRAADAPARPSVEVVFVLDTTSSMGGLIEGAKQRVWAIANEIAKGKPSPRVKMGLVAFRDKGDEYVTKSFDLSENLDATYKDLLSLEVNGGGDGPEHVIAGLDAAVEKMSWSKDPKTFKVVYLVGDAAPHEDYADSPTLASVMEKAVRRGLVVNSVQCGADHDTTIAFTRVARLGEGRLLPVPQDGGMVAVATPFDEKMGALSVKLESTGLAYGGAKREAREAGFLAAAVRGMASAPAAAERAEFKARAGFGGASDLAAAVEENRVALKDVKEDELPDALKAVPEPKREAKLKEITAERRKLKAEMDSLSASRAEWLKKNAGARRADSFDSRLVEALKTQAAKKGIVY
ncbi:MAG: VWA domain-containing protein [Elusimicrobiota bacterium]|nr:MAG: VWA domain-containing protein [Elusimicrobiota bacterium]